MTPYSWSQARRSILAEVPAMTSEKLDRAYADAEQYYGDRTHSLFQGTSLHQHALESTVLLLEFCPDPDAIIASILQHVLVVDPALSGAVQRTYGSGVGELVRKLYLLSHIHTTDTRQSLEDLRSMLFSVSDDDVRVLFMMLATACISMRYLDDIQPFHRRRLCRQSLQLFAPTAARLGMYALKYRLERTAFSVCYPSDAERIDAELLEFNREHGSFMQRTALAVRSVFEERHLVVDVMAREKQPYSIFQKMRTKSLSTLQDISDLFALRIIVPELSDCYQALGFIHHIGTPLAHRFKDYISFPKPNGYQSLHTCVRGLPHAPKEVMIEVQIRTREMHEQAEFGIAAHWMYKQVAKHRQTTRLSEILDHGKKQSQTTDTGGKLVDHIYVLTPHGDIRSLPDGSTPLDFAFLIHTDIGLRFKAARVNGSIVPIGYRLENGDTVDILTHAEPHPALHWLETLVSSSARAKLKSYFFSHERAHFLSRGKDLLNAELMTRHVAKLDRDLSLLRLFDGIEQSTTEREDLLVKIGMGSLRVSSILRHLVLPIPPRPQLSMSKARVHTPSSQTCDVSLRGGDALCMPYRYARCCKPEALSPRPEHLLGVVARTGIVVVHREGCGMTNSATSGRRLLMEWRPISRQRSSDSPASAS